MATIFSLYNVLWFFILYSFIGWCLEVVFCSANTGQFVNRGFLNGPVCPIYGVGGVLILLLLLPVQHSLLLLFAASVVITSLLELITGFALKKLFHTSWWDYSDEPFNIGGYICLKFSLAWGLAGVFLVKVLQPVVAGLVNLLDGAFGHVLLAVFLGVFLADLIVTVNVILKLNRDLGEITRLAKGLHEGSDALAKNLGNTAIKATDKLAEIDLDERREKLTEKWDDGKERLEALLGRHSFSRKRLLRAFPNLRSDTYTGALARLREKYPRLKPRPATKNQLQNTQEIPAKNADENTALNPSENNPENIPQNPGQK